MLWVYTPFEHVPCGVVEQFSELEIVHRRVKAGQISFTCPLGSVSKLIRKNTLIWPQGDETAFIVTTCIRKSDSAGKETVSVKGSCLKWLLSKRVHRLSKTYTGKTGGIMRRILTEMNTESKRAFPRFSWSISSTLGDSMTIETGQTDLLTTFIALCEASELRMTVNFDADAQTMVLKVTAGADRSTGNSEGNAVILLDETLETIENIEHTENITDEKNVMYIGDADKVVIEAGKTTLSGFERTEDSMMDSGGKEVTDEDGNTTTMTDEAYYAKKVSDAKTELVTKKAVTSVDGDVSETSELLRFGKDYLLGDIVSVRKSGWNLLMDMRLTEETLSVKNGVQTRKLTIGDPLPTIADRITMK